MVHNHQLVRQIQGFYEVYHQRRVRTPDRWMKSTYWPAFYGRTLEVGGGTLLPRRSEYVLVDLSIEATQRAAANSIPAFVADGTSLPFASESFDTVACYDVLEHVVDPPTFLAEMCRVARQRVVLAGPNYIGFHPGGFSRYLPLRLYSFLFGQGCGYQLLDDPYLKFDDEWYPDRDAVCTPNVGYVAQQLRSHGFCITQLRSWERAHHWLNALAGIRCLGQFMFVVGEKK